ncbi:MAG: universal stress protein [Pseudomonadota bacterium]
MYKSILLPVDLGNLDTQEKAAASAELVVTATGAELHLLAIVPDPGIGFVTSFFPDDFQEKALEQAMVHLKEYADQRFAGKSDLHVHVAHGTVYREIVSKAEECGVDLIVMGSHRPELEDYLISANTAWVSRHAGCSVMVVRP